MLAADKSALPDGRANYELIGFLAGTARETFHRQQALGLGKFSEQNFLESVLRNLAQALSSPLIICIVGHYGRGFMTLVASRDSEGSSENSKNLPFTSAGKPASTSAWRQSAAQGWLGNIDRFRHAVERIDPSAYLTHTYYGRWLAGLETLLEEAGNLSGDEIDARMREIGDLDQQERLVRAARPSLFFETAPPSDAPALGQQRETDDPPRFLLGDKVRTNKHGSDGHTRLPAYARDKIGEVVALQGAWVFQTPMRTDSASNPATCTQSLFRPWNSGEARLTWIPRCVSIFSNPIFKLHEA